MVAGLALLAIGSAGASVAGLWPVVGWPALLAAPFVASGVTALAAFAAASRGTDAVAVHTASADTASADTDALVASLRRAAASGRAFDEAAAECAAHAEPARRRA